MNGEKPREPEPQQKTYKEPQQPEIKSASEEIKPRKKRTTDLAPEGVLGLEDKEEMAILRKQIEEIEKKEQLEAQQRTLLKLQKTGLSFLIFGGWSGKIEEIPGYGEDYYPRDIDVFLDQEQLKEWQKFFEDNNFSTKKLEDKLLITDQETGASLDAHLIVESPRKDQWIEEVSHGTFYFPKEGFKTKQYGD